MMKLTLFTLLVVCLYEASGECIRNNVRCLEYTVLESHEGYEVREYPPIVWVSASGQARRKMDISRSLIKQLYAYLDGANDREEKVTMTIPVRTKKVIDGEMNNYTMAIPLLPEQSENPPMPLSSNVTVTREPTTVYVAREVPGQNTGPYTGVKAEVLGNLTGKHYTESFGGQARQDTIWDEHARILKSSVANDDSVDTSFYFMSVYDSPWRETDRLNELWMVKNA